MSQDFVKGRTTNHLTWVMVDATDFATRESAASAATTIKVYGKLRADDTVRLVSSGTGSLTNDIKHVGASALGLYTIGLAKADLSDASAAWYDQYIIALSCTGCAYQTIVVDGGIDASALSALQSRMSDIQSYLVALSAIVSDAHSAAILGASHASDAYSAALLGQSLASDAHSAAAQANSRVLLVQSRLSDLDSRLVSDLSDVLSQLTVVQSMASDAASAAAQGNSRVLLVQSRLSDLDSRLVSDLSDVLSQLTVVQSLASDAHSAATAGSSRALINQSRLSDVQSFLSDFQSDLLSHIDTTGVGLNASTMSDLRSAINGLTVSLDASNISDIASAVVAALPITSMVSDIYSLLSDLNSNFDSRVPKLVATNSQLSDVSSDLRSAIAGTSALSDLASRTAAAVWDELGVGHTTDGTYGRMVRDLATANISVSGSINDAAATATSFVTNLSNTADNFYRDSQLVFTSGLLSGQRRVIASYNGTTKTITLDEALTSAPADGDNFIINGPHTHTVTAIASAVQSNLAADLSDILSAAQQTNSRVIVNQSRVSDIYSLLSDLDSNFQSRVPKAVATNSQLSDLASDLKSAVTVAQSTVSDIYSLLSDVSSDLGVISGVQSDVYSLLAAGVEIGASSMSDLRSAVTANGMAAAGADPTAVPGVTASYGAKLDWITALSRNKLEQTATEQTLYRDDGTTVAASAVVSDDGTTASRGEFS